MKARAQSAGRLEEANRREAQRYAGLALSVSTLMAAFKIAVGLLAASHALLASALYSINDILSSIAIAVSIRMGRKRPDVKHPYGYGKVEFVAVGMVSIAIALGVLFMFVFSVVDIIKGVPGPPHFLAMSLATVSLVVSWNMSRKAHHIARKMNSPAVRTSAVHNHADAEGSLLALIGIGGAMLGFHVFDRIIAVIETLHLIALSGVLLAKAMKGLLDMSIPADELGMVEEACLQIAGVEKVSYVRSRRAGADTWLDIAVAVPAGVRVVEAHRIRQKIENAVLAVLGPMVTTQVRVQGPAYAESLPGAGGSGHA
jgi:cation diffusion facilitator family transporter